MFFPENHLFFKKTVVLMTFTAVAQRLPDKDPAAVERFLASLHQAGLK